MQKRKSLDVFCLNYPAEISPSINHLLNFLSTDKDVCLFIEKIQFSKFSDDCSFKVFSRIDHSKNRTIGKTIKKQSLKSLFKKILNKSLYHLLRSVINSIRYDISVCKFIFKHAKWLKENSHANNILSVDKGGLIVALLSGKKPNYYYSLEANSLFQSESILFFFFSLVERIYLCFSKTPVIVQSERRWNLIKLGRKNINKILYLPVTSKGEKLKPSKYLRDKYYISDETMIVLVAGSLGHCEIDKIINSTQKWPKNAILILHSSSGNFSLDSKAIGYFTIDPKIKFDRNKIVVSNESFSIEEVEEKLYAGADISIVLYPNTSMNNRMTAYSSGKLASACRAGLPVIVPDFPEFAELIRYRKFGAAIASSEMIGSSLCTILGNYSFYKEMSYKAYESIYRFEKYSRKISSFFSDNAL